MNTDAHGEVINGAETYRRLASRLISVGPVLIGWTDGTTHYDILFVLSPACANSANLQFGLKGRDTLYVSIVGKRVFGFSIHRDQHGGDLHPNYIGEKLMIGGETLIKATELLNGILRAMETERTAQEHYKENFATQPLEDIAESE